MYFKLDLNWTGRKSSIWAFSHTLFYTHKVLDPRTKPDQESKQLYDWLDSERTKVFDSLKTFFDSRLSTQKSNETKTRSC